MANGRGAMEKVRRATRTLLFMMILVGSLVVSSAVVIVAMADTIVPCVLLSMFTCCTTCYNFRLNFKTYSIRSSLADVPLLSLVRSVIILCTYYICDVHYLSNGPYLGMCLISALVSAVILSVKAVLFNSSESTWTSPPGARGPRFKQSWGMPAMFLSSMVLAFGHIVVAYRTQCQNRRRLSFQRIDPEAILVSKAVLHGYQKFPRSYTPGKLTKAGTDGRVHTYDENNLPVEMLADDDSHFISCEGLTIHYKVISRPTAFCISKENFEDAYGSKQCVTPGRTKFDSLKGTSHLSIEDKHDDLNMATKLATSGMATLSTPKQKGLDGIVLIHGFGGGAFSWRHIMHPLARHTGCVVVAFDRPGWGLTSRPQRAEWEEKGLPNPYELRSQVDALFSFCWKLGLHSVVLVGHDDGGLLALMAAEKSKSGMAAFQVEVKGIVLISVSVTREVVPGFARVLLHTSLGRHMLRPLLRTEIIQVTNRRAWHDSSKLTMDVLDLYKAPLRVEGWDNALAEVSRLSIGSTLSSNDVYGILKSLQRLPVLIASGAEDILVSLRSSQDLASKLPNSKLVALSGCGHLPHEESPKALLKAMVPFVSSFPIETSPVAAAVKSNTFI
eukprot:TRINITY_DN14137_c0_g1_i1.p1 TRINITY_DN14137_c0_g1~~TRINITY_DN14137_c0_g1_i1.p1  ORF type:complete len:614 (-),score=82.04 TRINITY_DN14137_c0_g1_i1:317-2158(-)